MSHSVSHNRELTVRQIPRACTVSKIRQGAEFAPFPSWADSVRRIGCANRAYRNLSAIEFTTTIVAIVVPPAAMIAIL